MKERQILFSGPMVRAILDGSKMQTRRIVKHVYNSPDQWANAVKLDSDGSYVFWGPMAVTDEFTQAAYPDGGGVPCPFGQPGDRLWVRESWSTLGIFDKQKPSDMDKNYLGTIRYRADGVQSGKLRPSIFMPRWASRITLEITSVRVERLQEISEADAKAEGVDPAKCCYAHYHGFSNLWQSIYTKEGQTWDDNPWVWVVEFKRVAA